MERRAAWRIVFGLLVPLALASCAGVDHRRLRPEEDASADGIRYYGSSLYLLIHGDGKGGITTKLLELPDPTKLMVAKPYSTMSSLESSMTFKNGILTQAKEAPDTSAFPSAILSAAEKVLPRLFLAPGAGEFREGPTTPTNAVPAPYLYKVLVEGDTVRFVGGPGDVDILVPLTAQAATPAPGKP
jgi:hypothetical protein